MTKTVDFVVLHERVTTKPMISLLHGHIMTKTDDFAVLHEYIMTKPMISLLHGDVMIKPMI
jgi:hypothetical protein